MSRLTMFLVFCLIGTMVAQAAPPKLDESPAESDQWGYRPASGTQSATNPPGFSWRPQRGITSWELQILAVGNDQDHREVYRADELTMNVHCPPRTLPPGDYRWRYRGRDKSGAATNWSQSRDFTLPDSAVALPMPPRDELLARVPERHPRLFVRPEQLPRLRELAQGDLSHSYQALVQRCDQIVRQPPPTSEPRKYPADMRRGTPEWKALWWGNRRYTIEALNSAATLAFTRLLDGNDQYGQLARRILMDCAKWDPQGATGYRYNDEAGMPYAYYFARTYTFVHDLLSEEERERCRQVMRVRGTEMYDHLHPRHLWRPYSSHSNRAWHFLGEVAIAFRGEIEEADDWLWFAMNVFYNVYPVWSDDDGGWHEGVMYWSSYIGRFTWWADIMHTAMEINAYDKPYFSQVGYYPIYLMPPGKLGGAFGDGATRMKSQRLAPLMSQLAVQSGNRHWQWYVDQVGGPVPETGYIGFVRGALPKVRPQPPTQLATSKLFRGIGQAFLNTTLANAEEDVQVVFKSSPMGTRSHGNAANNSFVLWAYGQRLLTRTGHYYMYGGPHHRDWVWSTRSLNNITVDGQGQVKRSHEARGQITAFHTTPLLDAVAGEAAASYVVKKSGKSQPLLDQYNRTILFVKPELIIVFDRLRAKQPATFDYWLHAINRFRIEDQRRIATETGSVRCHIDLMWPPQLQISQTDQYDPNPWDQIKTREWHLTASTAKRQKEVQFVALYRPEKGAQLPKQADLQKVEGGFILTAKISDGDIIALLPTNPKASLSAAGLTTTGNVLIQRRDGQRKVLETVEVAD
jgi:hypothetical protein